MFVIIGKLDVSEANIVVCVLRRTLRHRSSIRVRIMNI